MTNNRKMRRNVYTIAKPLNRIYTLFFKTNMTKSVFNLICLLCCLLSATTLSAQQTTSKDVPQLLASIESWKTAQTQLETHKKMLEDKIMAQQKTLETEYTTFQQKAERGEATQKEISDKQNYFIAKDNELKQAAQKAQQELAQKTNDLTNPIQEKLKNAIKAVATEGNFQYIVDSSAGDLLFLDPALDVTAQLKAKM